MKRRSFFDAVRKAMCFACNFKGRRGDKGHFIENQTFTPPSPLSI